MSGFITLLPAGEAGDPGLLPELELPNDEANALGPTPTIC